jgi:hypothetical protein
MIEGSPVFSVFNSALSADHFSFDFDEMKNAIKAALFIRRHFATPF